MRSDGTYRHKDHATNQTDVVRWRDERKTQLVQRSEMEPTGIRMEVKQQTCWTHGEAVETEAGIKGNTDAGHEGDGETTRHR